MPQTEAGIMSRQDLHENFLHHYETKFVNIANDLDDSYKTTLSQAMNHYSPPNQDSSHRSALYETIARSGLKMDDQGDSPASNINDVFNTSTENFLLGLEHLQHVFSYNIGNKARRKGVGARLQDIVTEQHNIPLGATNYSHEITLHTKTKSINNTEKIPTITPKGQYNSKQSAKIMHDALEDLPVTIEQLINQQLNLIVKRFRPSLRFARDNSDITNGMSYLTDTQRQLAAKVEIALVNEAAQLIGNDAAPAIFYSASNKLEINNPNLETNYPITLIGTKNACKKAALYQSFNTLHQSFNTLHIESISKGDPNKIKTLQDPNSKPIMIGFTKDYCLDYGVMPRDMVHYVGKYINEIILTNSHEFTLTLRDEADKYRCRIVFY